MYNLVTILEELMGKEYLNNYDCKNVLDNVSGLMVEIRKDCIKLDSLKDAETQYVFRQLEVKWLSKGYGLPIKDSDVNLIIKENKSLITKMIKEYKLVC